MTAHRCLFADGDCAASGSSSKEEQAPSAMQRSFLRSGRAWVAATVSREQQAEVARAAGPILCSTAMGGRLRASTVGNRRPWCRSYRRRRYIANIDVSIACLGRDGVVSAYSTESPDAKLTIPFFPALLGGFHSVSSMSTPCRKPLCGRQPGEISACAASGHMLRGSEDICPRRSGRGTRVAGERESCR